MTYQKSAVANSLEEGSEVLLDFTKLAKVAGCDASVLPVVVQDADSLEVLILAYANELALQHTVETGLATFWSTSRNNLWVKGATSGDTLEVVDIRVNCEQNSLLYLVRARGEGACHTKDCDGKARPSCYYRSLRNGRLESTDQA
jgi:phosphoribosyl-AMP cyclohydrolase